MPRRFALPRLRVRGLLAVPTQERPQPAASPAGPAGAPGTRRCRPAPGPRRWDPRSPPEATEEQAGARVAPSAWSAGPHSTPPSARPGPGLAPHGHIPPSPSTASRSRDADTKGTRVTHLVPRDQGSGGRRSCSAAGRAPSSARRPVSGPGLGAGCPPPRTPLGAALYSLPALQPGRTAGGGKRAAAPSGTKTRGAEARPSSRAAPPAASPRRAAQPPSGSAGGEGHPQHQQTTRSHRDDNELPCLVAARKRYPYASSLGDNVSKLGKKRVTQSKLLAT